MNSPIPSREIFWNVSSPANQVVMYGLFFLSAAVCLWGLFQRFRLWADGVPDSSRFGDWGVRFRSVWEDVLKQRAVRRERHARRFHTAIFWGFAVLLFTTTMVFIDNDLGIRIYQGKYYLAVTLLSDLFGLALLAGVLYAAWLRYAARIDRLHNTLADTLMLALLALLVVQGFVLEGIRIAVTSDPWRLYSPVGLVFSFPFLAIPARAAAGVHYAMWWFHTLTVFLFIALLPYSKFLHILSSSANLFFRDVQRPRGAMRYPGDLEELLEAAVASGAEEFKIGVSTIGDLTWKERLDLDACTSCGRCQAVCPAYNSGKVLSPKWMILDERDHMLELAAKGDLPAGAKEGAREATGGLFGRLVALDRSLLQTFLKRSHRPATENDRRGASGFRRADSPAVQGAAREVGRDVLTPLAGGVMDEDVFWSCTTCRACMEVCPVGIEHLDHIFDVRRSLALVEGKVPAEAQASLRAIETRGNPFGPAENRADWAEGLKVRVLAPGEETEVLYWVGCISAFDKRKQKIARSVATILNHAGVDWAMLGNRERCTGDPARRLGEENIFQGAVKSNVATLGSVRFKTVLVNCPHCLNTLRNEYSQFGLELKVVHHTQFIEDLFAAGRLAVGKQTLESLTYHDPCYLGRFNGHYDEPREVLVQLGGKVKEMRDSRELGMCCGAGGGHFWMDMRQGERINVLRVEQAAETGAKTVATGCPFCLHMLEDGIKLTDRDEQLEIKDVAEIVAAALDGTALNGSAPDGTRGAES